MKSGIRRAQMTKFPMQVCITHAVLYFYETDSNLGNASWCRVILNVIQALTEGFCESGDNGHWWGRKYLDQWAMGINLFITTNKWKCLEWAEKEEERLGRERQAHLLSLGQGFHPLRRGQFFLWTHLKKYHVIYWHSHALLNSPSLFCNTCFKKENLCALDWDRFVIMMIAIPFVDIISGTWRWQLLLPMGGLW